MAALRSTRVDLRELLMSTVLAVALYVAFVLGSATLNPVEFHSESAPIEVLQDLLLLLGAGVSIWLAVSARSNPWARIWLIVLAVMFLAVLGNEVAWGRRLFSWRVINGGVWPHGWTHNVNLRPLSPTRIDRSRSLTLLIIALGAIGYPIVHAIKSRRWLGLPAWFAPRLGGIPWAALVVFTVLTNGFIVRGPVIFGLSRFQFSQVEELFIYLFMVNYALARRDALRETPRPVVADTA